MLVLFTVRHDFFINTDHIFFLLRTSVLYQEFKACLLKGLINQRRIAIIISFNVPILGLICVNTEAV